MADEIIPTESNVQFSEVAQKWENLIQYSQQTQQGNWINAWDQAFKTNPYVQNTRLKQIKSLSNKYTREQLEEMLRDPSNNEQSLRSASHYYHNTISPIMKLNHMYSDILTYRTFINTNKINDQKILIKEYETLAKWKKSLDVKRNFGDITLQIMIEGKRFYYLREDIQKGIVTFQPLPSDYCKIVHRTDIGWAISFNMMYFMKVGVSPAWFAPEFLDYIDEFFNYYDQDSKKMTNIDSLPNDVTAYYENRNWFFWKELDISKAWVFSFDDSEPEVSPPLMSMFLDAGELNTYKLLEQELLAIPLKQIMTATVPMTKQTSSGSFSNDTAVTPDLIQLYQNIIQSILPPSTDFIAAPFDNFQMHSITSVADRNSVVGDSLRNFLSSGGISGIISTADKPNVSQVAVTKLIESAFISKIYRQYYCFLNNCVKNMPFKNDFEIQIEGDIFSDKDLLTSIEKGLSTGNVNLYPQYLSFFNQDLCTADGNMQIVDEYKIYDRMRPTVSAFQQSSDNGEEKVNGRHAKPVEDLKSPVEDGSNIGRDNSDAQK